MIGKTISHYKILEELGRGGMGIVYKAQDTKLDRLLALKFLPPHLTVKDTDKARFLQEAKAASAINHPNVCVIHDIQEHENQQFIIMEYVAGQTLREHVGATSKVAPLLKDIIDYAIHIAAALEAAHEEGIIHRDIKSENIMVSKKNQIKVMDFGLAKLKGSLKLTKTSSTVGTLAYMAPEQIEGKETDARSDIFSFGVVLYEMLTGQLPFTGEYESALMYAIINDEPEPVENFRSDISSELVHILNRSLEKDQEDRYPNMHEVLVDLKRAKRESSKVSRKSLNEMQVLQASEERQDATEEAETEKKQKRKPAYLVPTVITAFVALLVISFFVFNPFSGEPLPDMKYLPFTSLPGEERSPTFSPDGTQMAFSWSDDIGDNSDIYVKQIGVRTQALDRLTENPGFDFMPAWSPDGRYIAFGRMSEGEHGIYIMPARGGSERQLASVNWGFWSPRSFNLAWSPDNNLLAFSKMDTSLNNSSIFVISVDSRQIENLTHAPDQYIYDTQVTFSPDGKSVAFVRGRNDESSDIYTISTDRGEPKRITSESSFVLGLAWSPNSNEIIFSSAKSGGNFRLWRISADGGEPRRVQAEGNNLTKPTFSRQGNLIAYEEGLAWQPDLWRIDLPESNKDNIVPKKLIYSTKTEYEARFSPDGKQITYVSTQSGIFQIYKSGIDGSQRIQLTNFNENTNPGGPGWSPDGQKITFDASKEGQNEIYVINAEGGVQKNISNHPANDHTSRFSSDGQWIYFNSERSGEWQIWKIPAEGGEARQVTYKGGYCAMESPDGKWIFYTKYDLSSGIWRIPVQGGEETLAHKCILEGYNDWDLVEDGIYYVNQSSIPDISIDYFDFLTEKVTRISIASNNNIVDIEDIDISPDGSWLICTQFLKPESDIILVENFR